MSLAGRGAVAIWNGISPAGRENMYAWHGSEHMPERVGIPGFLRGRRYIAVHGTPEYFTLYEADGPAVVKGPDYLQRLNNPTPWTAEAIKDFSDVARSICEIAATYGSGQGGLIATWRYDVPDKGAEAHRKTMTQQVLPALAKKPGVAGTHLLMADAAASGVETEERRRRGGPANRVPRWIVLVEGWADEGPFDALCRKELSDAVLAKAGAAGPAEYGLYRLQNSRGKTDAGIGA